ncbi:hypothetical protein [uncultured Bacteroides sp.]|nr:hypothetical protein [uncultured Bacteroides sp.]
MDRMIDDFFIPDNEVRLPEELDYSRVSEYVRSAEAFSRSTYQSVYIIDYFRQNFLYVSPNPMCNHSIFRLDTHRNPAYLCAITNY